MTTLLISTRNAHKVVEIRQILGPAYRCFSLNDFPGAPNAVEDAETFAGNATKKALSIAEWLANNPNLAERPSFILADDSGLEVDALNGAPGVRSARFAADDKTAGNSSDSANNARLLHLLKDMPSQKRTARFRCVLALLQWPSVHGARSRVIFDGVCEGRITDVASGRGGFGYDPLFIPSGQTQSFAQLGDEIKNRLSHRARALEKLKAHLSQEAKHSLPASPS